MVIPNGDMREPSEARGNIYDGPDAMAASSLQPLVNMIPGHVITNHQGLLKMGIRVRIGERTDLRVRWPLGSHTAAKLDPRLPIKAVILSDAVHLESGFFRQVKRRWNRWIGTIILVETFQDRSIVSVRLHNDAVTIKCCGSMTGSDWSPRMWDTVNVVVDPAKISPVAGMKDDGASTPADVSKRFDPFLDARVWLRAQVKEIDEAPEGRFLSLLIGAASVSVFIGREDDTFNLWRSGMTLDIHVGRCDAWLKPCGSDSAPVLCGVLYPDSQSHIVTR